MANYCTTKLVFEGEKAELDEFEAMLRRLESMKEEEFPVETSWGSRWLGFIVHELGENWEEYNCKGVWYDLVRRDDNSLALTTESAWSICDDILNLITDKWPSLNYLYYADEPGCEFYETNDSEGKYFPARYYLHGFIPAKDENDAVTLLEVDEYFNTEQEVLAFVGDTLHHPVESLDDIAAWSEEIEALNDEHEDDENWEEWCYISVNKIEVVYTFDVSLFDDIEPIV